jgi:transcriptional regulator with XRE-family HTH domain
VDKLLSLTDTDRMTTANPGDAETTRPEPPGTRTGRIPADTFANRLVLARRLAGLTIRQAAAEAGLNYGSWSNWENGMRPLDAVEVCSAIADALDIDFNWLLLGGALAGPRGMPVESRRRSPEGPGLDTWKYQARQERPRDSRPNGRPAGSRSPNPPNGDQRRPVRISRRDAA